MMTFWPIRIMNSTELCYDKEQYTGRQQRENISIAEVFWVRPPRVTNQTKQQALGNEVMLFKTFF